MRIVDTHCHAGLHKYEPVETLLYHMDQCGVAQAVLIQHMGHYDNRYHQDCLQRFPGRLASAMLVEPEDDGTRIRQWALGGQAGIRLRPTSRVRAADPLVQWRTAAELDLVVSVHGKPDGLLSSEFAEILSTFPQLCLVLEHLGGIGTQAQPPYDDFRRVLALATHPNVYMKVPGLGEYCPPPPPYPQPVPLARMAVDAFGPQRLMWGSDFPPVSSREGYANALHGSMDHLSDLGPDALAWIFGGTARHVWGL